MGAITQHYGYESAHHALLMMCERDSALRAADGCARERERERERARTTHRWWMWQRLLTVRWTHGEKEKDRRERERERETKREREGGRERESAIDHWSSSSSLFEDQEASGTFIQSAPIILLTPHNTQYIQMGERPIADGSLRERARACATHCWSEQMSDYHDNINEK
jgi:hypothetical protein